MRTETARQRVFGYIRKHRITSAAQTGRGLSMSTATVRYHLGVLCRDGRVVQVGATAKPRRGRPEKLYSLSQVMQGNNLGLLLDVILNERLGKLSASRREQVMQTVAGALVDRMGAMAIDQPMASRLALAVTKLNDLHHQARWEAGPDGPRILFAHCPYAAIIDRHPELCRMDALILSEMTGQAARQTARIGMQGSARCVFQIGAAGPRP